jgi:hypothetical protein
MGRIAIGHRPDMTGELARQIFAAHFGAGDVYRTSILDRDFVVRKSDWSGVGVRVRQDASETSLDFSPLIPNPILQGLVGGFISYLFVRRSWKALEAEVSEFIQRHPAFGARPTATEPLAA